jgi:branched-chain amino acid transport system substrate-binding protein
MFRAMYRDDNASKVIVDEIVNHYAGKKLAIIHDKSAYGQGVAEYVRDNLNKKGVKEILFDSYDPENHDYSVLVTRLKSIGTEVLFIGGYPVEGGAIVRQLREAGSKAQVIAGDLSAPEFWKIAGNAGEGTLFVFPQDPRKEPGAKAAVAKLEKSGVVIDGYTLYGYAAAEALAQAIEKAGSTDPAKVADMLHKEEFKTVLGPWSFDQKGDVRNIHQVMFHWHNGQFEEAPQ